MLTEELRSEIDKLEVTEKLSLVEKVWDDIASSNQQLPLPEWQKRELDKRYKEYKTKEQNLHDWQSVHEIEN